MPAPEAHRPASAAGLILTSFAAGFGVDPQAAHQLAGDFGVPSLEAADLRPALLALAAECGARPGECIYLSTPITTGRNHLDLIVEKSANGAGPPTAADRAKAVLFNRQRAQAVAERVRAAHDAIVIDPTSLVNVPGWEQDDYHALWVAVIERYARAVVFVDDWQYSVGCRKEFEAAVRLGLPVMDQRLTSFGCEDGQRLVRQAAVELESLRGSGALLPSEAADAIECLSATRGCGAAAGEQGQ
ncbi:MAG TPA: hypothetical protein VFM54_18785 [Micromonosporaceae bacterium]|nr:hypothetical protein [Micromonosporaceae bacterium]